MEASLHAVPAVCCICDRPVAPSAALAALGFVACGRCGFVFRPDLDEATSRDLYEGGAYEARDIAAGYAVAGSVDERRHNALVRLGWLQQHVRTGRLLDVGAAGGAFVLEAGGAGFEATGVEPAPAFAAHARDVLGVDVRDGRVEDLELHPGTLDVATMWHVLEHVPAPRRTLAALRALLRPGGRLVLEVPNLESVAARRMGRAWTHLDPEVHVSQFTPSTLRALLGRAGFEVAWTGTVAHGAYLSPLQRWAPGHVAHRLQLARGGAVGLRHPRRHEFLRAVARRPAG